MASTTAVGSGQQQTCWICHLDESETPNQRWANACNCSLEAHEKCLLTWITREEHDGRKKDGGFKCPQCKAIITTEEPYDLVVAVREKLHRTYSRISPFLLLGAVTSGSIAGSAWYGYQAATVFAGAGPIDNWLFDGHFTRLTPTILVKLFGLSQIGPGLIITRAVPRVGYLFLPLSILYGSSMVARDEILSWPPSPEWVMTLMPCVQLTYSFLYREYFGPKERELNKILRGGYLDNVETPAEDGADAAAPANDAAARREPGLLANAMNLTQAVMGIFGGNEEGGGLELEVRLDAVVDGDENFDEDGLPREQPPRDAANPAPAPDVPPAAPAQQPPQQEQNQNQRNQAEIIWPTLTDVTNNMATSILLPGISWLMGELIHRFATSSWLTSGVLRRRGASSYSTGLLQNRWGRSLVGGCLFVVLKDVFVLYAKQRRADAKKNRKIKEVPKRSRGGASITTSTTSH